MPDIFLSYSREDKVTARRFADAFEREGLSVWWDATLNAGEAFDEVTEKALEEAKAVVVLWSKHSVASRWVRSEATQANSSRTLIPAMIEPCKRPIMFELTQTADLSHWHGDPRDEAWLAYLAGVKRFVEKGAPSAPAQQVPALAVRATGLSGKVVAVLVAVLMISGGIAWLLMHQGTMSALAHAVASTGTTSIAAGPASASPADSPASVAVMPFSNLTGDPGKDYLGDGMAEELINALTKVPGLTVPSRTSSFAYKGRNTDLKQIAKDLNVRTILEGSVRSAGDTIRITAQLIDAQNDRHFWSQTYDRKFTDLFKLQDDLAREIVAAFRTTMNADLPVFESQAPPTQDLEAYTLFLRASAELDQRTAESSRIALALLEQSVALDPKFARAYALMALTRYLAEMPIADVERDAKRAIELDPGIGAQWTLGLVETSRRNWVGAEMRYHEAVAASPGERDTNRAHALTVLLPTGHLKQALDAQLKAYRGAPASPWIPYELASIYQISGLDAEAIKFADLAVSLNANPSGFPTEYIRADAAARAGRYSDAADLLVEALPPPMRDAGRIKVIRLVYGALGDPSKKREAVAALTKWLRGIDKPEEWSEKSSLMVWFSQLGALDEAFRTGELLKAQFESLNPPGAWSWLWAPEMRSFRRDPRFQGFVTRVGMMPYWEMYGPPDECTLDGGKLACH